MITLKGYQVRALDALKEFLTLCARGGKPAEAFEAVQRRNGGPLMDYRPVSAEGLAPQLPYVCLRVPTGGGKTLMACHAVGTAITQYLRAERGVVLWLVPNTQILDQTADALRDPRHPYRLALETACGAVEVVTVEEALRLSRATMDGATVVVVATMQAFKAEETEGRRVYRQNGNFSEHILNVPADGLLLGPDKKPVPSLINALRLRRPVVIVDEAHNARSELSFSALGDVRPSCILEFTATPDKTRSPSNVLHQVSAAELKAADMAKLPVRVVARHPGQAEELLAEAVAARRDLEDLARVEGQRTGEYLRPILLIQAEKVEACEPLREKLVAEHGFSKDEVKISVGTNKELEDAGDLASPKSPVRVVITVQHLKEGWDCPFAYVLCSLRATRSATALEQIVGRVLRLPGARSKTAPELNSAYVFSVSADIGVVLKELSDALVNNGFTPAEAWRSLRPSTQAGLPLSAAPRTVVIPREAVDAAAVEARVPALGGKVKVDAASGEVTIFVPLEEAEVETLSQCVKSPEAKVAVRELATAVKALEVLGGGSGASRPVSPWERGEAFVVPLLAVKEQGGLFEFEPTCLLDHPWKLADKDASLADYDPKERPKGRVAKIDVSTTGRVESSSLAEEEAEDFIAALHRQVLSLGIDEDWTEERLVSWLDWRIEHTDILSGEFIGFVQRAVRGVRTSSGVGLADLAADRFRLREAVERRVQKHRDEERSKAFQAYLLPEAALAVDAAVSLDLRAANYEPSWLYEGAHAFKKHYFGIRPGELAYETSSGRPTEEFLCARYIDDMPEVEFWFRNLARKPHSFRLLTPDGWFYPDFVAKLKDGRILAIEYKGGHLWEAAATKREVGNAWQARSAGKCVFVMPSDGDLDAIRAAIG